MTVDPDLGGGMVVPSLDDLDGDGWWAGTGTDMAYASAGSAGLVLEFPVEVEVRLVPAADQEQQSDATIRRLIAALEGLS